VAYLVGRVVWRGDLGSPVVLDGVRIARSVSGPRVVLDGVLLITRVHRHYRCGNQ